MSVPTEPAGWNWAGTYRYRADRLLLPRTREELHGIVTSQQRVRVLGSRHSFSAVADTQPGGVLVDLRHLTEPVAVDRRSQTVRVSAGTHFGTVARAIDGEGFALSNLGSLPHITVVGAASTGTHGSGNRNPNVAASVRSAEIMRADGAIETVTATDPRFGGHVLSLGAVGVVLSVELQMVPTYSIRQTVIGDVPIDTFIENAIDVLGSAYSVSGFFTWDDPSVSLWVKQRDTAADRLELFGGNANTDSDLSPIFGHRPENTTPQRNTTGPWFERLPHFSVDHQPSTGEEIQSEYFLPLEHAPEALRRLRAIGSWIEPHLQVTEIRSCAADDNWISPAYHRDSVCIHFTWHKRPEAVEQAVRMIEDRLRDLDPRAHWGKVFAEQSPATYDRWDDMRDLIADVDPEGRFHNGFLSGVGLIGSAGAGVNS